MECSTLDIIDHKVLAHLSNKGHRSVDTHDGAWEALGIRPGDLRSALSFLVDEGAVEVSGTKASVVLPCNCSCRAMVRKQLRNANRGEVPLKRPKSKKDVGERTYVRSLTPQPLRSSGEDEEQNSVQQMAGKRVSGRRIATDVVERTRRRNTTLAWQDRPPEVWNATHLTGYFDAQTFTHLHGRSANRFKMKPLLAHFARMRREGIDSVTCKEMIDLFVQQQLAQPDGTVVASYWQLFVSQSGTLRNLLTTTAGQHYNNQPTSDDEGEWT